MSFIVSFITLGVEISPLPPPSGMASSPSLDIHPLLQLQEVDSSKAPERPFSPGLLPATYSPPVTMEGHTVCIPSPYADCSHDYSHGPLTFYSPSLLSYPRAPVTDSPSTFWPPSHRHPALPSLSLHCPPPFAYNEPWLESKGHSINANRWVNLSSLHVHASAVH